MMDKIINTIVTFIISGTLGYCVKTIKSYKEKLQRQKEEQKANENVQNQALVMMLQNSLTNTYFVYQQLGEIPDYVYKNWLNMLKVYEGLDGDDYIHILADKMKEWEIVKTDILAK